MTARLLYVCVRPQQVAADAEYASFRAGLGVGGADLARHDLVREPLPAGLLERVDAVVVGGSPFNLTDPDHTKTDAQRRLEADLERLAAAAGEARVAALFTCFGIGVVTRMLGGEVSRGFGEDTGPASVALTGEGRHDALFGALAPRFDVLTAHKEGSAAVPPGATLLASNDACPVQAYRVGERLYATQFHPEPTPQAFTERMAVYRNDGYFDADDYERVSARVLGASVTEPTRLLSAFAARFAGSMAGR